MKHMKLSFFCSKYFRCIYKKICDTLYWRKITHALNVLKRTRKTPVRGRFDVV